eukprot:8057744-Lingulodinium_polyedra.AAC.1
MLQNDAVKRADRRFSAAKCATHARTMKWRAHGAYARGAFRHAEPAKRAYDRIVAQVSRNAAQRR